MNDLRFASLRGASRQYIDDFDEDFDELEPDLDLGYEDPPHDGWSEIRPLYEAMRQAHLSAARDSA